MQQERVYIRPADVGVSALQKDRSHDFVGGPASFLLEHSACAPWRRRFCDHGPTVAPEAHRPRAGSGRPLIKYEAKSISGPELMGCLRLQARSHAAVLWLRCPWRCPWAEPSLLGASAKTRAGEGDGLLRQFCKCTFLLKNK